MCAKEAKRKTNARRKKKWNKKHEKRRNLNELDRFEFHETNKPAEEVHNKKLFNFCSFSFVFFFFSFALSLSRDFRVDTPFFMGFIFCSFLCGMTGSQQELCTMQKGENELTFSNMQNGFVGCVVPFSFVLQKWWSNCITWLKTKYFTKFLFILPVFYPFCFGVETVRIDEEDKMHRQTGLKTCMHAPKRANFDQKKIKCFNWNISKDKRWNDFNIRNEFRLNADNFNCVCFRIFCRTLKKKTLETNS